MPETQVATPSVARGGRPRRYADQEAFEELQRRVDEIACSAPLTASIVSQQPDAERRFIEACIIAIVTSMGADVLSDSGHAQMNAYVCGLLLARDRICAGAEEMKARERKRLEDKGIL